MDARTTAAVETVLADELLRNERIVAHERFGRIRLSRPTPEQDRIIADERRKRYQADLKDETVLSRDEIEQLATRRGMWSSEQTARMDVLVRKIGEAMAILETLNFSSVDEATKRYLDLTMRLTEIFKDDAENLPIVTKYVDLDAVVSQQERTRLIDVATTTEVDDLVDEIDELRAKLKTLQAMDANRFELQTLQIKQMRLFVDSLESRADRAEEIARLYVCTRNADTGKPLWPSLEAAWQSEAELIEFLLLEMHYFLNGVTDEFRKTLGKYGFQRRQSDTSDSSGDSPVLPPSSSDGESPASASTSSSPDTA